MTMRTMMLAALALLGACSGSAPAATHSWQVGDVSRIRVQGPFDVRVRTGVPTGVRATGPQDAIDRVTVEQHGETLVIGTSRSMGLSNWTWSKRDPLVVDVGVRALAAAALGGSGNVSIDRVRGDALDLAVSGSGDLGVGAVDVERLKLQAAGSGSLTAAGRAGTVDASLVGSGDIHGNALKAEQATVSLAGSGSIDLAAQRSATVSLAGSGDVRIVGPAACTVARRGSGDVTCNGRITGD